MKKKPGNRYIVMKSIFNFSLVIIGAFLAAFILNQIQHNSIKKQVKEESEEILVQLADTIEKNRKDVVELTEIYHTLNQSTTTDLQEIVVSGLFNSLQEADTQGKVDILSSIVNQANIPYLFIMDQKGTVFAAPSKQYIGENLVKNDLLSLANLNTLVSSGSDTCYVKETNASGSYYFYSDVIDTNEQPYYLVFGTNAQVLDDQLDALQDVTRVIENVVIGNNGFVFAVDNESGSFIYYEDDNGKLSGEDARTYGLEDHALVNNYAGEQTINGTNYFCVTKECDQFTLIIAANNLKEIYATTGQSWKWSTAGFVAIAFICLIYAIIVRNDHIFNQHEIRKIKAFKTSKQEYFFNLTVFKRILPVILLGVLIIFGISFYSTTMVQIDRAIIDSNVNINELENNFKDADLTQEIVKEYYEKQYLAKARILSFLFEENPDVLNYGGDKQYYVYDENNLRIPVKDNEGNNLLAVSNSPLLEKYCKQNNLYGIYLFDDQGRTIATNLSDWFFNLSFNEEDQSYPFREILDQKIDYYIQEMGEDEVGRKSQYLGTTFTYYTTKNEANETVYVSKYDYERSKSGEYEGNPITKHKSLLQIALNTTTMESILSTTDYEYLIEKSTVNNAYLVLFDNTEDHTILYSPKADSIGKKASDVGLKDNAFSGNYIGFQRANGIEYLIDIQYYEGYYIGTAIMKDTLTTTRFSMALTSAALGLVFILAITLLITFSSEHEEEVFQENANRIQAISDRIMFMITTPSGESATEKATSRWDNKNIPWKEKTPEQKLSLIFFIVLSLSIVNIFLFAFMVGKGRIDDSILSFIISGNWDKGFNIFAYSACGLVIIAAILFSEVLNIPIQLITSIFGTKSETVGHLLSSVIKYAATIYSIFYCLYLLGFDSTSLMTSAGILSLVIGLGSQSLIKDVVAGIFIIFEGEFRVGDIVTIGGYRGQVLDVGLRTTKIMSADNNIKIFNNSEVNGVINMTRVLSLCLLDVQVGINIPLKPIEERLKKEFPSYAKKFDKIMEGPYYNGVVNITEKYYTINVSALCKEEDIWDIKSALNNEIIKIMHEVDHKEP